MEGVALTFAHGYSGITDVIGHPMVQDPDLALLVGHALKKLSDLFPDLRGRLKTAVILIHIVEPHGFILPAVGRGQHQFRSHIIEIDHIRFSLERASVRD